MSTTVELVRANERYARLRAAVEQLAGQWESASVLGVAVDGEWCAKDVRALLAAVDS